MNSHQRRKQKRKFKRVKKSFESTVKLAILKWDNIVAGVSPAGRTEKWEASNVTID